jgi:glutathione S-transferase
MLTLHIFGPAYGLPDGSPFGIKAMMLLKLAGLPFETKHSDLRKAPRGKLPVLDDDGEIIPDSTFIRMHLENKYKIDFDAALTPRERGIAWSIEKMLEDHAYWLEMQERWLNDVNFERGPAINFKATPPLIRPLVIKMIRRRIQKSVWAQGSGRYSKEERRFLAERVMQNASAMLGDNLYMMGDKPCGADATCFAFTASALTPLFDTPMSASARQYPNLIAYCDRMYAQFFPEFNREVI